MNTNLFYKSLATVSTFGIVIITVIQFTAALKKENNSEDQSSPSHWLVYGAQHSSVHRGSVLDKIKMKDEKQCQEEGPKLEFLIRPSIMSNKDFTSKIYDDITWSCIQGE